MRALRPVPHSGTRRAWFSALRACRERKRERKAINHLDPVSQRGCNAVFRELRHFAMSGREISEASVAEWRPAEP